jgi:hypothetical protein
MDGSVRSPLLATLTASLVAVTGCEAPPTEPRCEPRGSAPLRVGVAHVAGDYAPSTDVPFLAAGTRDAARLGARSLKVYLTPEYATKYPKAGGWAPVRSLAELAATPDFRAVFAQPFDTFVVTTYSFSLGVGDPWRTSDDEALYRAEADELEALTRHLLSTWAGSGKRFILQNWEGDWALLGGGPRDQARDPARARRMARWLAARQAGVARAREAVPAVGVSVTHAVEVNLVLDEAGPRVLTDVLPLTCVEAVSYSSWEALAVDTARALPEQQERISARLERAVDRIRGVVGEQVEVYLGEVGFAEREHPAGHVAPLLRATLSTAERLALSNVIYWQIYDNECDASGCRGLWLVRPDGTPGDAAGVLAAR